MKPMTRTQTIKVNETVLHAAYLLKHSSPLPHTDSYKVAQAEAAIANSMIARDGQN
jgi:hypothetical protein